MIHGDIGVREVRDSEVVFYKQNGWVKLEGLISNELAGDLLARAHQRMGDSGAAHKLRPGRDLVNNTAWQDYHNIAEEDEVFGALAFGKVMGRNAQRLMARDVPVRAYSNLLAVKLGTKQGTTTHGTAKTDFHQDFCSVPLDRVGFLTFWIALDEVTPEMGAMRFYTGSHRLGSLGRIKWFEGREMIDVYPELGSECPLSPSLHYRPGDATVHHSLVVHGAPQNQTNRPRWPFIVSYFPADTKYTGGSSGSEAHQDDEHALRVGEPYSGPRFPQVCP